MSVNQTEALEDLSFLLGETSVPTSGIEDRKRFIQRALERVYRLYDFPTNEVTATVAMVAGVATLPTNLRQDGIQDIRIAGTTDRIFTQIPYQDQDGYSQGSNRYWLTGSEGSFVMTTTESSTETLEIKYTTTAPIINASISAPLPQGSSMLLARGALINVRLAEDPQADISQEEALFQFELEELIATHQRNKPPTRGRTIYEQRGTYLGDIDRSY